MKLSNIYFDMLQYPNSPKIYRALKDLYQELGKQHESKAFLYILETRYKELNNDNDTFSDKKQSK